MQTAECRTAVEQLSQYITAPKRAIADIDAALSHIRDCPDCKRRIGYLVRALEIAAIDRLGCQTCQERLPEYIEAIEIGQASAPRWRGVALHLALCPHCAAAYADLTSLIELAQGRRGVEPPPHRKPDLAFLDRHAGAPARRAWRLDAIGRLVIEFSAELLDSLLPPQSQLAPAGLKSGAPATAPRSFALTGEVTDQDVAITVEPQRGDPAHCRVTVRVDIPSRGGWPNLSDTLVTLRHGSSELARQPTDAFGNVVFEHIAAADLAQLVFVIERGANE